MTMNNCPGLAAFSAAAGLLMSVVASAQLPVIDAASLAQLAGQSASMTQQLAALQAQLLQLQEQYKTLTGQRGMQSLLTDTVRNYLPVDWEQLNTVLAGGAGSHPGLGQLYAGDLTSNAVLSQADLTQLPGAVRNAVQDERAVLALHQALSQAALANSSDRFGALQQFVSALGSASDAKATLDLQARIGAEQGMLLNEQTKLQVLFQSAVSEAEIQTQREREQVIAAQGRFATRFEPTPH